MKLQLKIWQKIMVAIVGATALVIFAHLIVLSLTFRQSFLGYLDAAQSERITRTAAMLESRYEESGNWSFLEDRGGMPLLRERFIRPPPVRPRPDRNDTDRPDNTRRHRPPRHSPPGEPGLSILDADGSLLFGPEPDMTVGKSRDLTVNSANIGTLYLAPAGPLGIIEREFSERRQRLLNLSAVITLLLASIVALLFSRHLLSPIQRLTDATKRVRNGQYDVRVERSSSDELGTLADDFNDMAETLQRNQAARRQWVADISHELRTPVAVLRGQLDALEDGVRPFGEESLRALSDEVDRVARLVSDLETLARSDSGELSCELSRIDLGELVGDAARSAQPRFDEADLSVTLDVAALNGIFIAGDADRLKQVLSNLFHNSIGYTSRGGEVRIRGHVLDEKARLVVEDTAPGVPEADLTRLFDRLYRVEQSRNRGTGGSGLGLSICQSIVTAHGGSIRALQSELGGLAVVLELPLA